MSAVDGELMIETTYPKLPKPVGELRVLWKVDPHRWELDAGYRGQVTSFVRSKIIGGSLSDARVVTDQVGDVWFLFTETWFDEHGDMRRTRDGRPHRKVVGVDLAAGTVLP